MKLDKETRHVMAPAWVGTRDTPADLANTESSLRVGPYPTLPDHLLVSIIVHPEREARGEEAAHILIPPNLVDTRSVRKLRQLTTYARRQGRLDEDMDVEDELKAMGSIARTLDSIPDAARLRVLAWLEARQHQRFTAPGPEESVRIAKERLLS